MKHRPIKKPTAKQAIADASRLTLENAMLKLDIRQRTIALLDNLWSYETVMDQILEQAATIGEARRWYTEFKEAVNQVPMSATNHKELLREELAKIDIFITDEIPDHGDMIDKLWENKYG